MSTFKDYAVMSREDLQLEEKTLKRAELWAALAVGFLFGVIGYGLVQRGFGFVYIVISGSLIYLIMRSSKGRKAELAAVRAELGGRV